MNIAYFGNDWHMGCLETFKNNGHTISHIFINSEQTFNREIRQYAKEHNISVTSTKPEINLIEGLLQQGIDCLFSIEYAWLIPIPENLYDVFTMNVHPSMLPDGRGTTPVSWIINSQSQYAGVTFHKLTNEFDSGDIIYQKPLSLEQGESFETLMVKLHLTIPQLLNEVLSDFKNLYKQATKQGAGSTWPKMEISDRLINWNMTTSQIKSLSASCGRFGIVAILNNETLLVNNIEFGQVKHQYPNGTIIKEDDATYVVAVSDGFVILMKRNIIESIVN